jgi:hypothetical protein
MCRLIACLLVLLTSAATATANQAFDWTFDFAALPTEGPVTANLDDDGFTLPMSFGAGIQIPPGLTLGKAPSIAFSTADATLRMTIRNISEDTVELWPIFSAAFVATLSGTHHASDPTFLLVFDWSPGSAGQLGPGESITLDTPTSSSPLNLAVNGPSDPTQQYGPLVSASNSGRSWFLETYAQFNPLNQLLGPRIETLTTYDDLDQKLVVDSYEFSGSATFKFTTVPEPAGWLLGCMCALGVVSCVSRRRRRNILKAQNGIQQGKLSG